MASGLTCKVRAVDRPVGTSARGGLRVIYYYLVRDIQIWLLSLYDKDEALDLSPQEKRLLKTAIEAEVRERSRRRTSRGGTRR